MVPIKLMRIELDYDNDWHGQPSWWKNFVLDVASRIDIRPLGIDVIYNEFEKIGVNLVYDELTLPVAIEFKSEEHKTWFILRWS